MAPLVVTDSSGARPANFDFDRRGTRSGQLLDEDGEVGAHGRLASGQAQTVDFEVFDEDAPDARSPRTSRPR